MNRRASTLRSILAAAAVIGGGCATAPSPDARIGAPNDNNPVLPLSEAQSSMRTTRVSAGVLPRGSVPYDNRSLPLVSPDGRYVATQTGVAPPWNAIVARRDAETPAATHIEIHELPGQAELGPQLVAMLARPAILGRACDAQGFLIESPQEDGSRWIGYVTWRDGNVTWLVTGADVNAFAALGPQQRLAWSRRAPGDEHFDLVIRTGGDEWTVASQGEDWLMPTWSGRADGLFAFTLKSGQLDLVFVSAMDSTTLRQSLQRVPVATGADVFGAYQSVSGSQITADSPPPPAERLLFYHPSLHRPSIWAPLSTSGGNMIQLDPRAFAATVDPDGFALLATEKALLGQDINNPAVRVELLSGMHVPRRTAAEDWPYMLLSPREGEIDLMSMRLITANRAAR